MPTVAQHTETSPSTAPTGRGLSDGYAEAAVLSAVFHDPERFYDLASAVDADAFAHLPHQLVFSAMQACEHAATPIDVITVGDELARTGNLSRAGDREFLDKLAAWDEGADNLHAHLDIVKRKSRKRRLLETSQRISQLALDPGADADAAVGEAEEMVFSITQSDRSSTAVSMSEAVASARSAIANARDRELIGHPSGLTELDRVTAGLKDEELVVVAARPGMGKSALALQIARHVAETSGDTVYVASHEMSVSELAMRLLSSATGIGNDELRMGRIPDGLDAAFAAEASKLEQLPLLIDDQPPETIPLLRSELRRVARRAPLAAVVVDYLQLMRGDGSRRDDSRAQEIADISRGLKRIAKELSLPVIALSQLNRGVESRHDKRPTLADLRDSGAVEQDADNVLFIYRDAVYSDRADPKMAELILAKQRNGPAPMTINVEFDGPQLRFADSDRRRVDSEVL